MREKDDLVVGTVHSYENHNFFKKLGLPCPYCEGGSTPVHKSFIRDKIDKGEYIVKSVDVNGLVELEEK